MQVFLKQGLSMVMGGLIVGLLLIAGQAIAQTDPLAQPVAQPALVTGTLAVAPLLHYQGQLLDPATGGPKPTGTYPMTFNLYNTNVGGSALWSETKNVAVTDGLFATSLGDTSIFNLGTFNGQSLWLGVQVGNDLEATPANRLAMPPTPSMPKMPARSTAGIWATF